MKRTKIEWTESTWNPVTGCNKISRVVKIVTPKLLSRRLKAMGQKNYVNGFKLTLQPHMLKLPLTWKKPQMIFVNSMSDLFHKDVPIEYIPTGFRRDEQSALAYFSSFNETRGKSCRVKRCLNWSDNIWMGVSVENKKFVHRIDYLRHTKARIKVLSLEPLLSPFKEF